MSLLEIVVTIAVLGVLTSVVGLTWRRPEPAASTASAAGVVAAARRQALASGTTVTVRVEVNAAVHVVTVTPDGRVRGGEILGLDALTGRPLQRNGGPPAQSMSAPGNQPER